MDEQKPGYTLEAALEAAIPCPRTQIRMAISYPDGRVVAIRFHGGFTSYKWVPEPDSNGTSLGSGRWLNPDVDHTNYTWRPA